MCGSFLFCRRARRVAPRGLRTAGVKGRLCRSWRPHRVRQRSCRRLCCHPGYSMRGGRQTAQPSLRTFAARTAGGGGGGPVGGHRGPRYPCSCLPAEVVAAGGSGGGGACGGVDGDGGRKGAGAATAGGGVPVGSPHSPSAARATPAAVARRAPLPTTKHPSLVPFAGSAIRSPRCWLSSPLVLQSSSSAIRCDSPPGRHSRAAVGKTAHAQHTA